jgi:hypothetical protein
MIIKSNLPTYKGMLQDSDLISITEAVSGSRHYLKGKSGPCKNSYPYREVSLFNTLIILIKSEPTHILIPSTSQGLIRIR